MHSLGRTCATLDRADLTLQNLTTGQTIDPSLYSLAYDAARAQATVTFSVLPAGGLPDGAYRLTVRSAGVTDRAGNALASSSATGGAGDFSIDFNQITLTVSSDETLVSTTAGGSTTAKRTATTTATPTPAPTKRTTTTKITPAPVHPPTPPKKQSVLKKPVPVFAPPTPVNVKKLKQLVLARHPD